MRFYFLLLLTILKVTVFGQNCPNANSTKICYINDNNPSGVNTDFQTVNVGQTWTKWFTVKNNGATACPPSAANSSCNAVNYTLKIFSITRNGGAYGITGLNSVSYPAFTVNKNVNGNCSMSCSFTQAGNYYITYDVIHSNGNALPALASRMNATVTVNAPSCTTPATPSTPTSNSPQCNQVTITRGTPPSGVTWYWQGTNANGTSTANSNTTFTATTSGTYYLRAYNSTGAGCWSNNSASVTVTVNPTPTIVAGSNSPVTAPNAINLTATGGATSYAWTGPSGFTSTQQNPTRTPSTTAMSGSYCVTATLNGCTSTQSCISVTVNAATGCTAPATPSTPTSNSPQCNQVTITR
ncbi:MAG: hypothetical protein ACOVOV_11070, partial [Dolichospermum sp.]